MEAKIRIPEIMSHRYYGQRTGTFMGKNPRILILSNSNLSITHINGGKTETIEYANISEIRISEKHEKELTIYANKTHINITVYNRTSFITDLLYLKQIANYDPAIRSTQHKGTSNSRESITESSKSEVSTKRNTILGASGEQHKNIIPSASQEIPPFGARISVPGSLSGPIVEIDPPKPKKGGKKNIGALGIIGGLSQVIEGVRQIDLTTDNLNSPVLIEIFDTLLRIKYKYAHKGGEVEEESKEECIMKSYVLRYMDISSIITSSNGFILITKVYIYIYILCRLAHRSS